MGQYASRPDEASSSKQMRFTGRDGNTYSFGQDTIWVNGKVVEQNQFAQQFPEAFVRMAQNPRNVMLTGQDTQSLRPEEGGHHPGPQDRHSAADVHNPSAEPFFFPQMWGGQKEVYEQRFQGHLGASNGHYDKKAKIVVEMDGQQQEVYSSNRQFSCSSTDPKTREKLIEIQRRGQEAQLQLFLPAFQRAAEEAGGRAFVTEGK